MIINNIVNFYIVSFSILLLSTLYNINFNGSDFLDKNNTDNIKGFAIICIIFHHIVQKISNPGILMPFKGVGYLFVSIFFFLSGYGLVISYMKKDNYLNNFFIKRLSKIYIPFVIVNSINLLMNTFILEIEYTAKEFIFNLTGINLMSSAMWYLVSIIFWYIVFYIVLKNLPKSKVSSVMFGVGICYFIICYCLGLSKNWYDTAFTFPMGVFVGLNKDKIEKLISEQYIKILCLSSILFIITFILNYGRVDIGSIIIRAITSITFTILFLLLHVKIDVSKNKFLIFIGSISFELYLIHDRLLEVLNMGGVVNSINLIAYFIIIIFLSLLLNKMCKYINRKDIYLKVINNEM